MEYPAVKPVFKSHPYPHTYWTELCMTPQLSYLQALSLFPPSLPPFPPFPPSLSSLPSLFSLPPSLTSLPPFPPCFSSSPPSPPSLTSLLSSLPPSSPPSLYLLHVDLAHHLPFISNHQFWKPWSTGTTYHHARKQSYTLHNIRLHSLHMTASPCM